MDTNSGRDLAVQLLLKVLVSEQAMQQKNSLEWLAHTKADVVNTIASAISEHRYSPEAIENALEYVEDVFDITKFDKKL